MENLELDLSTWRNATAPDSMAGTSLSKAKQRRIAIPARIGLAVLVAVGIVLLLQPSPAQAAFSRMKVQLKQIDSVWIETDFPGDETRQAGKGVTVIAHGATRRDGREGHRSFRGQQGSWHYNSLNDKQIVQNDKEPRNPTTNSYLFESFLAAAGPNPKLDDLGSVIINGTKLQLLSINHYQQIDYYWIESTSGLPLQIKQYRQKDGELFNTCRFRYDVKIDPKIMTPEALDKPLTESVRPYPVLARFGD